MKRRNILMLMSLLVMAAISFSSCSKDKDDDEKEPNNAKYLVGVWESDNHSTTTNHFIRLNLDFTGEELTVTYSGGEVSTYSLNEIKWKEYSGTLEISKGSDIHYYNYTLNDVHDHVDLEWKGDTEGFSRISNVTYNNVLKELPIDADVVGSWAGSTNSPDGFVYFRYFKDGTSLRYEVDNNINVFRVSSYNWKTKDDDFWIFVGPYSATYKYSLDESKKTLNLNTYKWLRVSDSEYDTYLPDLVSSIKGAWKDKNGWKKVSGTTYNLTYLYFYDDGTFRTIDVRGNYDGSSIYGHYSRLGYYKFDGSKFTYSIDNGASKGNTLYLLTSATLQFYTTDGFLGSGADPALQKVDDSEVAAYLE